MYAAMDQWAEIRRRALTGEISKREACRLYDLHWLTLKKILTHEEPPGYRRVAPPRRPTIEPVLPVIRQILDDDTKAPKKQRHTARRIWQRLKAEHGFTGGYTAVKDAVREMKVGRQEVFRPPSHPAGEGPVDDGFAEAVIAGVLTKIARFVMSRPYADAVFVRAYPRECSETFLDGHVRAFAFFGGVPRRIAYDNTKTAVATILGSRDREVTREFARLKSHHLFDRHFCRVRRPNEKGPVERRVEYARSNVRVPVPNVPGLDAWNVPLEEACRRDQDRSVRGKSGTVASLLADDRAAFRPIPARPFEARRVTEAGADSRSRVRFDTNAYSVPTRYAHRTRTVIGTVEEVRIAFEDRRVARHPRCGDRERSVHDPVHDPALLERKPGGFDFARPLEGWDLPGCFDVLRRRLDAAAGDGHGTRAFVKVLRLLETYSLGQLADAVECALGIGAIDPDRIRVALDHRADRPVALFTLDGRPHLAGVRVEPTDVTAYGALREGGAS